MEKSEILINEKLTVTFESGKKALRVDAPSQRTGSPQRVFVFQRVRKKRAGCVKV